MIRSFGFTLLFCSAAAGACIPVVGDRIFGRDLALALPAFSSVPGGVVIGYAPAPGTQRIFSVAELGRIARANHVTLDRPLEVCFEIPMRTMTEDETRDSMKRVLPAEAELTIVELPKTSIPAGHLEFALAGLEPSARGARIWRGFVRYGETLRMPVWARVMVRRKIVAVVAAKDLTMNAPLDRSALRLESVAVPLDTERLAINMEDALGRAPKKAIRAGDPIPLAILTTPQLVHRGDAIKVEVRSGTARLVFDAVAETSAGDGEMVELRNPDSGKTFRARVSESGRAVIVVPSRQAL